MPADKIRIIFTPEACLQMFMLVAANPDEIAWHGTVDRQSDTEFVVDRILLYPQVVTGSTVTADEKKYAEWLTSQPDGVFSRLRLQAHSHVNMPVSPSSADLDQQASIVKQLSGEDYYIFMIVNKRFEINAWICDLKTGMRYDRSGIDVVLINDGIMEALDTIALDAKALVRSGKRAGAAAEKVDRKCTC